MSATTGPTLAVLVLAAGFAGAGPAAPARLSATGLRPKADRLLAFSPQYPLWSDGLEKQRWAWLPPGARIDTRNPDAWRFPVGAKFWKEFRLGERRVETRFLWHAAPGHWLYATYRWRADQSEADLAPAEGVRAVADLGGGLRHDLPAVQDCKACHENGPTPVLGFTALQLSPDRDPLAPHASPLRREDATLATLQARGLLDRPHPEWQRRPPRIEAEPLTRAALGYLAGNCGHCHRGGAGTGPVDLDLHPRLAGQEAWKGRALDSLVRTLDPARGPRVVPGQPERSSLVQRMASRHAARQMPPLGTVKADPEGLALVRRWIGTWTEEVRTGLARFHHWLERSAERV